MKFKNGILLYNDVAVAAISVFEALFLFRDFLASFGEPVYIAGHNIYRYDTVILTRILAEQGLLKEVMLLVAGCLDTLDIAKSVIPKNDVANYKQPTLVTKCTGSKYIAHNSMEDVKSLELLYFKAFSGQFQLSNFVFPLNVAMLRKSFRPLIASKKCSEMTARKMAKSGLAIHDLKVANDRNKSGIKILLSETIEQSKNVVRITKNMQVINKITSFFTEQ